MMKNIRLVAVFVCIASLANFAEAQCGNPNSGNCCEVTANVPGCQNVDCCSLVCAELPWCCSEAWNIPCVNRAALLCHPLCGSCGFTSQGDCCVANGSPGCKTATCCESVCAVNPSCCENEWDQSCADLAWQLCSDLPGCEPPPLCPGSGHCCSANGTTGCSNTNCCNTVCDLDPYCCEVEWNECCAELAVEVCAHPTWPEVSICDPPPMCGPGNGPCNQANGTPGCDDAECCAAACACDPFCCLGVWDEFCVGTKGAGPCGVCNLPECICHCETVICDSICDLADPVGNCFETGGTCCHDCECCEKVCACDPFCCDFQWDALCVGPNTAVPGCSAINLCCHLIDCNPADLTFDNIVNVFDIFELLSVWGPCPGFGEHCPDPDLCPADFNQDGLVNVFDLLFMLANWG